MRRFGARSASSELVASAFTERRHLVLRVRVQMVCAELFSVPSRVSGMLWALRDGGLRFAMCLCKTGAESLAVNKAFVEDRR